MSGGLNSLHRAEGGDRHTFREALHLLPVEIEVGRVALLPDVNATRSDLESLGLVETTGDEREPVKGHGVEEDIGVSGRTNTDAGERWSLHGLSEEKAESERGGRVGEGRGRAVEREQEERGGFDGSGLYL